MVCCIYALKLVQTAQFAKCMHRAPMDRKSYALDMSGAEHLASIVSIVLSEHCLAHKNLTFHTWTRRCGLNKC